MVKLQWVHGPITVVTLPDIVLELLSYLTASMGPRSDNRGYVPDILKAIEALQSASMGPRSDNRGYERDGAMVPPAFTPLQWVHGPITVVTSAAPSWDHDRWNKLQWVHGPITVVTHCAAG